MSSKILLFADDSATMRTIMEKTFAAEDIEVVTVPSGEAAIAKAKEIRPGVVIADAGMAGQSGYDVCKLMRDDPSLANTPVIIMSGVSNPYDEVRGREVGVTEHMKKPFDTTKLIERVNDLAGSVEAAPASAPAAVPAPVLKPRPPQAPLSGSTLHAFPSPSTGPSSSPSAPTQMRPPERPAPSAPRAAPEPPSVKQTMEFAKPTTPKPVPDEVVPIEISEQPVDEAIQVGTLAELAQMDASGGTVPQEVREDAIELDEPIAPSRPEPKPAPEPKPIEKAVRKEAVAAASEVVSRVDGLTPEQADAITALTAEVVERVVWEVVPDLAETIIKEHIAKLLQE